MATLFTATAVALLALTAPGAQGPAPIPRKLPLVHVYNVHRVGWALVGSQAPLLTRRLSLVWSRCVCVCSRYNGDQGPCPLRVGAVGPEHHPPDRVGDHQQHPMVRCMGVYERRVWRAPGARTALLRGRVRGDRPHTLTLPR
jgi:hypothetical protein